MYDYCEPRTTIPPSPVVSLSDCGTGGLWSIPGWAHKLQCFFPSVLDLYAELLHTRNMELKNDKWASELDFKQGGMCDQQSLGSACAYAQSDQSLCLSLEYYTIVKLLTEHHLEFVSLNGGWRGSSESTHVKIPHLLEITCIGSNVSTSLRFILNYVRNMWG